jgi:hypothetical protein
MLTQNAFNKCENVVGAKITAKYFQRLYKVCRDPVVVKYVSRMLPLAAAVHSGNYL